MDRNELMNASCRVALAGLLHDLGKFAERARIEVGPERLDIHKQQYCRRNEAGGKQWYSHVHAAYTALAWDTLEPYFPEVVGDDVFPFAGWGDTEVDDSLVNAASRHHKPETFLQWIIATADRVASGFERERFEEYNQAEEKNHYSARLLTLFEQIDLIGERKTPRMGELQWRYPLTPLSVGAIFPVKAEDYEKDDKAEAQGEYHKLWQDFINGLEEIPYSHRYSWELWLDHFESLWCCYAQAIPSATAFGTRPEVSLYDHSRAVAALATALWRYHHERGDESEASRKLADYGRPDWDESKFLLVQGDFFGIQNFLFATGGETQKHAARLLRGRSFYVSLLTELAALVVLDELSLPPTSQIINAAGKFLIVAPDTERIREALVRTQQRFDQWFLQHTYGQAGIGLAWTGASCNDFLDEGEQAGRSRFGQLIDRLFDALNDAKARRFGLCGEEVPSPVFQNFLDEFDSNLGVCSVDGRSPATCLLEGGKTAIGYLALDQINVGKQLAHKNRLLISRKPLGKGSLRLPIFGYHAMFASGEESIGKLGTSAREGDLLRVWDYSLPEMEDETLFHGYARRNINGYVPLFGNPDERELSRYDQLDEPVYGKDPREPKTFEFIACDDRRPKENGDGWVGIEALTTLKGDVDNLGAIFERGMERPTFAKMAALSRQMNNFFAVWLPWYCKTQRHGTYTVFAGGDDFFLIGPWLSTIRLARDMRREFSRYVAGNHQIHFSAGLSMTKPGIPVHQMGELAEQALEQSKARCDDTGRIVKDAVTCFGYTIGWDVFDTLLGHADEIDSRRKEMKLSTRYLYGLQELADSAEELRQGKYRTECALWRSRFAYRTARMLERVRGLDRDDRRRLHEELAALIAAAIEKYGVAWKIALFVHLYQQRN